MEDQRIATLSRIQYLNQEDDAGNIDTIQELKQEYNRIVERVYHDTPAEFWDIIEVFPPEIWIRIIQESLPEQNYQSALLLLTMLSTKWQQMIISTPILWARIQICGLDEDFLATIEVFTHLSGNVDLDVTLYVPFYLEPEIVDSILAGMHGRMRRLAVVVYESIMGDPDKFDHYFNKEFRVETRKLLGSFQDISSNVGIDLQQYDTSLEHRNTSVTVEIMFISPGLESTRDWWLDYDFKPTGQPFRHLEAVKRLKNSEEAFEWFLSHSLDTSNIRVIERKILKTKRESLGHTRLPLSNLTQLCLTTQHFALPMTLLSRIAPQLLALELKTLHSQYSNVLETLSSAIRLTKLSLTLCLETPPGYDPSLPAQATKVRISSLRELFLCFNCNPRRYAIFEWKTQVRLLTDFCALYPNVDDAFFSLGVDPVEKEVITPFLKYLSQLRSLKRLKVYLRNTLEGHTLPEDKFPALEALEVSRPSTTCFGNAMG